MEKKKGKELDPAYKSAKMGVLDQIKGLAEDHMKGDIAGLKKVSVMAPDEEGLKEGLETAKEVVSEMPEKEESEEGEKCAKCGKEPCECESSEMGEMDKLSPEEQAMLAKLLKKMKD
jgi:hypothetical protein